MKTTLEDLGDVNGKRVLMRVDFNVPISNDRVSDDFRLRKSLPSILAVLSRGGRPVLLSHLGSAGGSLDPVAEHLRERLNLPVRFVPDLTGTGALSAAESLGSGEVLLLENLRSDPREVNGDETEARSFAGILARLGHCFLFDAFGAAHRPHASVVRLPECFPGTTAAGPLVLQETENLSRLLHVRERDRPFVLLLGGAKVESKLGLLKNLGSRVDSVLIGGAMAHAFLKAKGRPIGDSPCEPKAVNDALEVLGLAASLGWRLEFPCDHLVACDRTDFSEYDTARRIPAGMKGFDIGPATTARYLNTLRHAKTVFWNGPMGCFEDPAFAAGTRSLATFLAHRGSATRVVVGGGDSAAAVCRMGLEDRFAHVSTGGGASLDFLANGGRLPGLEALPER